MKSNHQSTKPKSFPGKRFSESKDFLFEDRSVRTFEESLKNAE